MIVDSGNLELGILECVQELGVSGERGTNAKFLILFQITIGLQSTAIAQSVLDD